ncbi:DMT family transporter [Qipengyuania sp. 1NDH17]|uniref:DMT family transporter n=1 Tax=Qipengyuania polymorpha TaxID=2867234 RepID=A0ABS7J3G8_9SPHN|nr:DMT family transporter [Qipengyuania polymorpha]MBX7459056.1 DMT family transporter [Qipengyuania polymorpha]
MMSAPDHSLKPVLATMAGIALFSAMDAVMKSASIAVGAYSAYLLRCAIGFAIIAPFWYWRGGRMPKGEVLKVHLVRGVVVAFMGWTFFASLVRLPLAEAIAISFVAPLIALYLAAILLGETIERRAVFAALLGLAGVVVIVGGRIGREKLTEDTMLGLMLIGISALLYAWNLVLQRQQALVAGPAEVSTFQNGVVTLTLLAGAPFLLELPEGRAWLEVTAGALLAVGAALFLAWAYARAEAQRLVPIEYTGFLWASLFGWLYFGEGVSGATIIGAALIIIGCWIATRRRRPEQSAL